MNQKLHTYVVLLICFLAGPIFAGAQSPAEIQERLKERLPKVDNLKLEGLVGENNAAYLEARGTVDLGTRKLIAEENSDRKQLYEIAARRTGSSLAEVEKTRAQLIRERSPKGIWLEDPTGNWFQK